MSTRLTKSSSLRSRTGSLESGRRSVSGFWFVVALTVAFALPASAQQRSGLPIKDALATAATGCAAYPTLPTIGTPPPSGAEAEARRLFAVGQDAALQGEHATARDVYLEASRLTPSNARLAYNLGREYETLQERTPALREYCRYLLLSPNASDGDEVRGRVVRLTPAEETSKLEETRSTFRSAVELLRRRQYLAADSAFAAVAQALPQAAEPVFNRGLSRAARGDRESAVADLEKYLELAPNATDRQEVRDVMARMPQGVFSPGSAFLSGVIVPGLGQMSTGRPIFGVLVLGAVGGAVGLGLQKSATIDVRTFNDPFGTSYIDSLPRTRRPNLAAAVAGAATVWVITAIEATAHARRSRSKAASIIAQGAQAPESRGAADAGRVSLLVAPATGARGGTALGLRIALGARQ